MRTALLLCRLLVGITFAAYGAVKLLGGQFHHGDFVIDSRTTDGAWLVWCFYGYSRPYSWFIGLCELVPGLLVLFPRTKTLGALALLAVSLNITVMDFCFGFPPVKYTALLLTALCGILVAADYRKLKPIFWDSGESGVARDSTGAPAPAGKAAARPGRKQALIALLALGVATPCSNLVAVAVTPGPEEAALARCAAEGWERSQLRVRHWQKTRGDWGIDMEGYVDVEATTAGGPTVIRVLVGRPTGFVGWRAIEITRGN